MSYDPALGNPGDFFYHYTTRSAAFEHILPQRRLRLSPAFRVNDPLEAQPALLPAALWLDPADPAGNDAREVQSMEAMFVLQQVRRCSKVLSLTIDASDYEGDAEIFGRGYSRARMWDQYAEHHQGVCLVLRREAFCAKTIAELQQRSPGSWEGPVAYERRGILADAASTLLTGSELSAREVIDSHLHRHATGVFFTKLSDWASEHEYRFVERSTDETYSYVDLGDCLAGVILGHAFPDWQTPGVFAACEAIEAQPWAMRWDMSRPEPRQISRPNA